MPARVLWVRGLAVSVWPDHSSIESCVQLASFPARCPRDGDGSGSIGPRHDFATACRGDIWYVHDGNSGGHVTREHPVSIAGYSIVAPSSASSFSLTSAGQAWPSYSNRRAMIRGSMARSFM